MTSTAPEPTEWLEIAVELPSEYAEPVTHLFSKHGDGRVFVQQIGDWDIDDPENFTASDSVTVFGYLVKDDTLDDRKSVIEVGLNLMRSLAPLSSISERVVRAEEWENQSFPAVRVGSRIVISPMQEQEDGEIYQKSASDNPDDVVIFLSPGLAFGTGNHPTTRMCLLQLEAEAECDNLRSTAVLDVGCGSGVLSIAVLKLGAKCVWGLDIDENAVRAARRNVRMSGVSDAASVTHGTVPHDDLPSEPFDIVLANITSRVIMDILDELIASVKLNGIIIVSGILADSSADLRSALNHKPIEISSERHDGDWIMMRLVRTD